MSAHNICFHGEIRKIFTGYPPLSRPMISATLLQTETISFTAFTHVCFYSVPKM